MNRVFISILNYNGDADTKKCLKSLNDVVLENILLTVVVLDNGSKTKLVLDTTLYNNLSIILIRNEENKGFSGGHNDVIAYALSHDADYVMLLNNDATIDKRAVVELVRGVNEDKAIGAVVPKIYFTKGQEYHHNRYKENELGKVIWYAGGKIDWNNVLGVHRGVDEVDTGQYDENETTEFATGCAVLFPNEVLRKVGLFNEKYFLYYEDADLSMRIKKAGYQIYYIPKAMVWHDNAKSAGGSGSTLQDYFTTRNRLLFGNTYASLRTRFALFREAMRLFASGRTWQKRGVIDYFMHKFGKGSFGI